MKENGRESIRGLDSVHSIKGRKGRRRDRYRDEGRSMARLFWDSSLFAERKSRGNKEGIE